MSNSDYRQELTNKIINQLEKGAAPWTQEWSQSDNRLFNRPYNPNSEKTYRGINSLYLTLISLEKGYSDPRWCTFKQAKDNGWHIKVGSKGTRVEFWKFAEEREITDDKGNKIIQDVKLSKPMVFGAYVFNVQQMEGVPPFEKQPPHKWEIEKKAETILNNSGAAIEHRVDVVPHYLRSDDKIVLPNKEQFKTASSYYSTVLHEVGHWTGAKDRLDRDLGDGFGTVTYAKEELRAELASYFLASEIGIHNELENHASYMDYWIKVLKEDKNEIFRAARDAEKITDYILDFEKEKILSVNNVAGNQKFEQKKTPVDNITTNFAITDIRLMVDFNRRQEAKELGAKWDKDLKTWYVPKGENLDKFKGFMGEKVVNLRDTQVFALYEERSEIKNFGGFWNNDKKEWYLPAGSDIKNIPNKFFVEHEKSADKDPTMEKEGFANFAKSNGLLLEGEPIADGKFHRVPAEGGRPNSKDGSYVYFDDASGKAGWIKNFKTGFESSFGESGINSEGVIRRLSSEEIKARQEERLSEYNEAAKKAKYLVEKVFKKAETHPYLETKGIKAHNAMIDKEGALIIPLRNIEGEIRTFQRILDDGKKGYMKGGEKSGSYFSFGSPKDKILICEGFATGASIYEATRIPTIAAMDTGNLERVAMDVRNKYGEKMNTTIAADNDHMTKDNPGMKYAQKAAEASGGVVIFPNFTEVEKAQKLTDFNDIAQSRGNKEVKHQILENNKELYVKIKKNQIIM